MLDTVSDRADLETFARAFEGGIARASAYEGSLSSGVIVGDLAASIGADLEVAVVLGGVEGELPGRARSSPLLSADDREAVGPDATSSKFTVERDRRRLLAAMAGAARFVLTWREQDSSDGRARVRSRFVGDSVDATIAPSAVGALRSVASGALPAIDEVELVSATLVALRGSKNAPQRSHLVRDVPALAASVAVSASRRQRRFDRFSGRVGVAQVSTETVQAGLSPTTLETYAECPFRYFLSRELSCEVVAAPERRLTIDPRDRGSIAHEILERFVAELISTVSEDTGAVVGSAERLAEIAQDVFGRYERLGRTGARSLWLRERRKLLRVLENERERDALRRVVDDAVPIAVEWAFGGESGPSVEFDLGERTLAFRGKVDRIDRQKDGSLAVVDYKTGKSWRYTGLRSDPVDRGRHLQLVVYALAARAGLVHGDSEVPIQATYRFIDEGKQVPVDLGRDTVERARDVLNVIVDGIESGHFPFNPGEADQNSFSNCRYCDFDNLCPADRDLFWKSARTHEDLAGVVSLLEPEEVDA